MACHTYVINQWDRVIHLGTQLTTYSNKKKRALHVVLLPSTIESPLQPIPTFDISLLVLHIPLPPSLLSALEPAIPISTPTVPISDLPKPS